MEMILAECSNNVWMIRTVAVKMATGEYMVRVYGMSFCQVVQTKTLMADSEAEAVKMARMIAFGE